MTALSSRYALATVTELTPLSSIYLHAREERGQDIADGIEDMVQKAAKKAKKKGKKGHAGGTKPEKGRK